MGDHACDALRYMSLDDQHEYWATNSELQWLKRSSFATAMASVTREESCVNIDWICEHVLGMSPADTYEYWNAYQRWADDTKEQSSPVNYMCKYCGTWYNDTRIRTCPQCGGPWSRVEYPITRQDPYGPEIGVTYRIGEGRTMTLVARNPYEEHLVKEWVYEDEVVIPHKTWWKRFLDWIA